MGGMDCGVGKREKWIAFVFVCICEARRILLIPAQLHRKREEREDQKKEGRRLPDDTTKVSTLIYHY